MLISILEQAFSEREYDEWVRLLEENRFTFDRCLSPEATQTELYGQEVESAVTSVFDGHNACVFAYGATGTGIRSGWNACNQIWVNQQRVAEVGYQSSHTPSGCVTLAAGLPIRLDLYNRHHNANLSRSFKSSPRWCYGGASDCTPDRKFQQNELEALKSAQWMP